MCDVIYGRPSLIETEVDHRNKICWTKNCSVGVNFTNQLSQQAFGTLQVVTIEQMDQLMYLSPFVQKLLATKSFQNF